MNVMETKEELAERIILAWVKMTGALKNTRITQGMIYNEAIVMLLTYNRYREDGQGLVSFKEIVAQTGMFKSLVNRTIDSLVQKGYLARCEGADKRTTFIRPLPERLNDYLRVHEQSLELVGGLIEEVGEADAEAFARIAEKIWEGKPLKRRK